MARSKRGRSVRVAVAPVPSWIRYRPIAVVPIGRRVARLGRDLLERQRVRRRALVRVRPAIVFRDVLTRRHVVSAPRLRRTLSATVGEPKRRTVRRLCKCSDERSEQQRVQSREFFREYGSRGAGGGRKDKRQHACEC